MRSATRITLILFSLVLVILLWTVTSQSSFERSLNSLFISFDDFTPSYIEAITKAGKDGFDYEFPPLRTDHSHTIPPIIHFIWYQDLYETHPEVTSIPHDGSQAPRFCTEKNPGFTVNIWNETAARALLEKDYSWFLPTYDGYRHPIQRIDAAKYFILWHYGGIYMDLDVACRKSLVPLIEFPAWFPRASPLGVNNDVMASRAGHPLMWKMVDSLRARDKNLLFPWVTIFWTTGPKFTSDMLQGYLEEHGVHGNRGASKDGGPVARESDPNSVLVLPREFYSEEFTFFGHSPGGMWHGKDVAVILWLVDRPWIFSIIPILAALFLFLYVRRRLSRRSKAGGSSVELGRLLHD